MQFNNHIELVVRSGDTGEVKEQYTQHNAIADDFLCGTSKIFGNEGLTFGLPYCFLLPDGAAWSSFTWDRTNPWCPYACTANRTGDQNNGVDQYWKPKTYFPPSTPGNPTSGNPSLNHKLFYEWTSLPYNISLRAIGLTGLQEPSFGTPNVFGVYDAPMIFVPQTLVQLPSAITVNGLQPISGVPSQTPDILEITYFLSITGVS